MARVVITTLDDGVPIASETPRTAGETTAILGDDRPIQLRRRRLPADAGLRMTAASTSRLLFVWSGSVVVNDETFTQDAAIVVEQGAACDLQAGEAGCELLEFQSPGLASERKGGHVHALRRERAPSAELAYGGGCLLADGDCPTCEVWLHMNELKPNFLGARHCHDQHEVIVCTGGTLQFGTRTLRRGGVLAVDKEAYYTFNSGDDGASFINYRPAPSMIIFAGKKGRSPPREESLKAACGRPTLSASSVWSAA